MHWFKRDNKGYTTVDPVLNLPKTVLMAIGKPDFVDVHPRAIVGKYLHAVGKRDAVSINE